MSKRTRERRGRETRRALRRWTRRRLLKRNTRRRGWKVTRRRTVGPAAADAVAKGTSAASRVRAGAQKASGDLEQTKASPIQMRPRSQPAMSCRDSGPLTRSWQASRNPPGRVGPMRCDPLVTSEVRCDAAAVPHGGHWVGQRRSTARGPRPRRRVASAAHAPGRRP